MNKVLAIIDYPHLFFVDKVGSSVKNYLYGARFVGECKFGSIPRDCCGGIQQIYFPAASFHMYTLGGITMKQSIYMDGKSPETKMR